MKYCTTDMWTGPVSSGKKEVKNIFKSYIIVVHELHVNVIYEATPQLQLHSL